MKSVTASAPGKLLLLGDHAVVYGFPCIVTAVDQRIAVTVSESDSDAVLFDVGESDTKFLDACITVAQKKWGKISHISVRTKSEFSQTVGLGSSAAVTVAFLFALAKFFDKSLSPMDLFHMAYEAVLLVQGVGSGFDVAIATYGGTIRYIKDAKELTPIDATQLPLIVGYTGIKADTATIVKEVKKKYETNQERVTRIFEAIGGLVDQAVPRFAEKDWERVGKFMDFDQEYLRDLGVSSEKLESLIIAAKEAGALGAKLSGAGGGDCMIALSTKETKEKIEKAITKAGGQVLLIHIHAEGVRQETTDDQNELFVVVDTSDTILGYKTRFECHHDKTLIHRTVGALIYNNKGDILLQKRSLTKDLEAGKWGISCGGHVTKGQTYEEAVARELKEELGISVSLEVIKKHIIETPIETEMAMLYKGTSDGPFITSSEEVDHVAFFSPREISLKVASKEIILTTAAEKTLTMIGVLR